MEKDAGSAMAQNMSREAEIFGIIVAIGFSIWFVSFLNDLSDALPLWAFVIFCVTFAGACLAIARSLDKRDAARKAREQSFRASFGLPDPSDQDGR